MQCVWRILLCALIIFFASTSSVNSGRRLSGVDIYENEPECISQGGLCVKTSDCLDPHPNRGLCPRNAPYGIECCYRMPIRPAPCHEHLGECMPQCNPRIQRPATDCLKDQVCCVLV